MQDLAEDVLPRFLLLSVGRGQLAGQAVLEKCDPGEDKKRHALFLLFGLPWAAAAAASHLGTGPSAPTAAALCLELLEASLSDL